MLFPLFYFLSLGQSQPLLLTSCLAPRWPGALILATKPSLARLLLPPRPQVGAALFTVHTRRYRTLLPWRSFTLQCLRTCFPRIITSPLGRSNPAEVIFPVRTVGQGCSHHPPSRPPLPRLQRVGAPPPWQPGLHSSFYRCVHCAGG